MSLEVIALLGMALIFCGFIGGMYCLRRAIWGSAMALAGTVWCVQVRLFRGGCL